MSTMTIEKDKLVAAYNNGDSSVKNALTNLFGDRFYLSVKERVKTFNDACAELGVNFQPNPADTPDEVAYKQLKIIVRALNEGWEPDFSNSSEYKWYPFFDVYPGFGFSASNADCTRATTDVGARLCFKSEDLAIYAAKQFTSIYQEYLTIKTATNA